MGRTTVISIVNGNGVVLCEYLPQEVPLVVSQKSGSTISPG